MPREVYSNLEFNKARPENNIKKTESVKIGGSSENYKKKISEYKKTNKDKDKKSILEIRASLLEPEQKERQNFLLSRWEQGQLEDSEGNLSDEKIVISHPDNSRDLQRDIELLSLDAKLPKEHRDLMEQRLDLIKSLADIFKKIPDGQALYIIVSSLSPSEREAIPAGMAEEYFNLFKQEVSRSSLSPSEKEITDWQEGRVSKFAGKKFFLSYNTANRMHITLIDNDGYPTDARFEIGKINPNEKIFLSSVNYFSEGKFAKYGSPEEVGKKLSELANQWIDDQRPNLENYKQILEKIKQSPAQPFEKAEVLKVTEFLISLLRYGKAKFTDNREVPPGEFMTNSEDALVLVRDLKFDTYGVFRSGLQKVQKMAQAMEMPKVAEGLNFFLNEDAGMVK